MEYVVQKIKLPLCVVTRYAYLNPIFLVSIEHLFLW